MSSFPSVVIEAVRQYWDKRPCNLRHSPSPVGTRQYFDEVEARKYFVEPHIPLFAQFDTWKDRKVLEIGCGIGTDTINFARAGALVSAVDLSPASIELAKKRSEIYGLSHRVKFYIADAEKLSQVVPAEPFDLIYAFGVIHHTPNPQSIIHQIRQHYSHPGSLLKFMVYHRYSWKVLWIIITQGHGAFWNAQDLVARYSEAQSGCPVTYTYSRRGVRQLLNPRFQIDDMYVEHIFPYRIRDYVNYRYVKEWYFRHLPTLAMRWLERILGWHLCVTARPI